jgi:tetratricopeptide (TPR) repeat protein
MAQTSNHHDKLTNPLPKKISEAQLSEIVLEGFNLHREGKFDDARDRYEKALSIQPNHPQALKFMGTILSQTGKYSEAISYLSQSLELDPDNASCLNNLANALREIKRYNEALIYVDRAIKIKDNYADAHYNRAVILADLKKFSQSLESIDLAITHGIENTAAAYNFRGIVFFELKLFDDSIQSYRKAIAINPNYSDPWFNEGLILRAQLKLAEAKNNFVRALAIDPRCYKARWAIPFLSIPIFSQEFDDIKKLRDSFMTELSKLDEWFSSDKMENAFEAMGTSLPFYLSYQELDNKECLTKYSSICTRIMQAWKISNSFKPNKIPHQSDKIKIGIISEHIRDHSVWFAITKGLILDLDREKFELHIFYLGNIVDAETMLAKDNATSFTHYQSSLLDWTKAIQEKEIEVLLFPEVGMCQLTTQIANLRLAPVQILTWGHPDTSGIKTMDYYLSADLFEGDEAEDHYTEKLIKLPNLGCNYSKLTITPKEPDLIKLGIAPDNLILLCPGTSFKYGSTRFDTILVGIALKLTNCKFIFFNQQKDWTSILKERFKKSFNKFGLNYEDYIIFIPWLNKEEFYGLMHLSDIFLDTIGFSGFNTAMQSIDCALPIVTLEGRFMRGRLASGILKRMGLEELVAHSNDEYINIAVKVAQDKDYRKQLIAKIIERRNVLYNDPKPIRALENFLIDQKNHGRLVSALLNNIS